MSVRLSRWGWSRYETQEALRREGDRLGGIVEVLPFRRDAEIIVVNSGTPVDAAFLEGVPSARLVITNTSGYEHLDLEALGRHGVRAARLPMSRCGPVVERTLWSVLHGCHGMQRQLDGAARGRWEREGLPEMGISTLSGSRIGVIGYGVIGRRVASILRGFGARVVVVEPRAEPCDFPRVSLEEAASTSDILTLHCNLSETNRGLVDRKLLTLCRPGIVLVNTARGPLIDWACVDDALDSGRLGVLVSDVFPDEPWPSMQVRHNLVSTPHSAGYHRGLSDSLAEELAETVECFVRDSALPFPLECTVRSQ